MVIVYGIGGIIVAVLVCRLAVLVVEEIRSIV